MISLDDIQSSFHSIKVEPGAAPIQVGDNGGSLTVDASNLDIRDLVFATDKVDASGSSVSISGSVVVTATDLDIRNLVFATDKVDVSGSSVELGATTLAALESITVVATDLDIRNLVFATDKVDVSGSSVSTTPAAFDTWATRASAATSTASQIDGTPLAGRLYVEIQNLGSVDVFLGPSGSVTTVNGLKLPKGSSQAIDLDDGAAIYAITASGTADLRLAEYAA